MYAKIWKSISKKNCNYTTFLDSLSTFMPPKSGTGVSPVAGEINPFSAKRIIIITTRKAPSL